VSDLDCVGQVWWEDHDSSLWLVLGRDADHWDEWKVLRLTDGHVGWAADLWFGSFHTRRVA
jgi:hypothetical protein